jgi:hypothetical protein
MDINTSKIAATCASAISATMKVWRTLAHSHLQSQPWIATCDPEAFSSSESLKVPDAGFDFDLLQQRHKLRRLSRVGYVYANNGGDRWFPAR